MNHVRKLHFHSSKGGGGGGGGGAKGRGGEGERRGLKSDIVCFCLQVDEPNRAAY